MRGSGGISRQKSVRTRTSNLSLLAPSSSSPPPPPLTLLSCLTRRGTTRQRQSSMSPQNVCLLSLSHPSFHSPPFKVPHLGLHAAAATGNIGLAKYAISHGQPVNSVIDGVLPLHAACSGGGDMVVRLLIDNGADVNAPRCVSLSSGFVHPRSFSIRVAAFLAARHIT